MLRHLYIRNFVLVSETEIDFDHGMTILTGETGAGKSIIFDALSLAVGKRAESGFIRHGCDQAEIVATFTALTTEVLQWMESQAVEATESGTLILRRVIRRDGRSRAFINATPSTTQSLRSLSTLLIDIQGQHAHQRLLKRGEQLHLLDHYADSGVLLTKMSAAFRHWEQLIQQQQSQLQSESERNDRIALLNFQLDELDRLALQEGELAQLEREHSQLTNGEKLIELGQQTYQLLDGEDEQFSAIQQLYRATSHLESLESLDPTTQPLRERLVEITVLATDIASELQESVSNYTLDPARLEWLNERLTLLSDLARKHHCTPETLFQHHQQLQQQRDQLRQQTTALEQLENKISQAEQQCHQFAEQLHQRRADAIPLLQQAVNREIHQLGMAQSHFHIALSPLANQAFRLQGHDEVQFEVQTNTGSPLAPLTKVASGGELSRISLAIQLAAAHRGQTPTLIFDEVDSGIGGGTAEQVGKKLRQLGESAQILCVTHLPQVAAQGHHHLKIEKAADHNGEHTTSQITLLDEAGRTFEVARMLGGMEITQQTHAHASEMVSHSSPTE